MKTLLDEMRSLPPEKLPEFADGLRTKIIESVSRNGGHLASSCGCVELIVALHRVFNTPEEKLIFDVGHQAYAHKLLTGREAGFEKLRRFDGISGFTNPAESVFDPAVSGHAGTALSTALGHCAAHPEFHGKVIAVVGDGSMGCGVTLEALNHAATVAGSNRLIVVLNDNRMSISRNVGMLSRALNRVIAAKPYNQFRKMMKKILSLSPRISGFFSRIYDAGKSVLLPPALLFETLGFRYFGAVNGNDLEQLLPILERIKKIDGPVLLHIVTQKGYGCDFAEKDPTRYHGIAGCDPDTGEMKISAPGFSEEFGKAMLNLAEHDRDLIAVCPAMLEGTGLSEFAKKYPERCFDTGIAEEHALTFAAGMAAAGKHPVCAFYDTFLQRALDGVYHDAALANLPLVIAVDRSGAVTDGPTHHGIYNCSFLRTLPNVTLLTVATPGEIKDALKFALNLSSPVILRYPKGRTAELPRQPFIPGKAVIRRPGDWSSPVIWATGGEVQTALDVAEVLEADKLDCTVVDARFLKPFDREKALEFTGRIQFSIEDHSLCGGLYSALAETLAPEAHCGLHGFGWSPAEVTGHGEVPLLRRNAGLDVQSIAEKIRRIVKKS